jgi:DNA-binding FrmR family transcriptional regulator
MRHSPSDKQKLLNRVRRLRGQIDALERAIEAEQSCTEIVRLLSASRGAINGAIAAVLSDHIQTHMIDPGRTPSPHEREATAELIDVLSSYVR